MWKTKKKENYEKSFPGFVKGSDVGFGKNEIKLIPTEELKHIRYSVYEYLTSTKLKKRNANFKLVYARITDELKEREKAPSNKVYTEAMKTLGVYPKKEPQFTQRKRVNVNEKIDRRTNLLIIPQFFNDDNLKVHQLKKVKKIEYKQQPEEPCDIYKSFLFSPKADLELEEEDYSIYKIIDPIEIAMNNFTITNKIYGELINESHIFSLDN